MVTFLASGRVTQVVLLLLFCFYAFFYSRRSPDKDDPGIRRLPAVEALGEAVGRATELGRPVHFTFGGGPFDAQTFAGFSILGEVARLCATYSCRLLVTNVLPEVQPMTEELVRQGYAAAGKPEFYKQSDIRFFGRHSFNAATIGIIEREQVAANVMIGSLMYESVLFIEASARNNAIQIGGTMNTHQLPFVAAGCDYTLIGAEMFAASAYLSKDPRRVGWLMSDEICKVIGLAAIIVGTIFSTFGSTALSQILVR